MTYINKFLSILNPLKLKIRNMRYRFLLFGVLFTFLSTFSFAQTQDGKLKGKVTDKKTHEAIFGAQVILKQGGERKGGASTNGDGDFVITPIEPGTYELEIHYLEYVTLTLKGIRIEAGLTNSLKEQDLLMTSVSDTGNNGPVGIVEIVNTTIRTDNTQTGNSFSNAELDKMASKNINTAVVMQGGVTTDASGNISVKGDRPGQSKYYVDGIPYGAGAADIPLVDVESLDIITGGVPAEYGDLTGAPVSLTTKGPSSEFHGRIEGLTSQFLDPFGYNLITGGLTGPLLKNKKHPEKPLLGFSISGQYNHTAVPNTPAIDVYQVQPSVLQSIINNPVIPAPNGQGFNPTADYVTMNQMEKSQVEPNTASSSYAFTGKIEYKPTDNIDFTVGANTDRTDYRAYIYTFSMFNSDNNPEVINTDYSGFARFRQSFVSSPDALIQDAYYTIQFSYVNNQQVVQDPNLKDNYFEYGYLGTYNRTFTPVYTYQKDTVNGKAVLANYLQGYQETAVTYQPGGLNADAENYTKSFFNLNGGVVQTLNDVAQKGGLINGQSPAPIYSLWAAPGTYYSQYSKTQDEQYDLNVSGTATLAKKHTLKFGIEYQQKVDRSYTVGNFQPIQGLWTLARQLMNTQLTQLDKTQPIVVNSNGNFTDTINYPYQIAAGAQTAFDANFRNYLISEGARDNNGRLINQQTFVNIDQYAPSAFKLSMFTPDELLNNGNSYVGAYGYDYNGNTISGKPSLADFLDPTKRLEGAYNPIYTAGYIEDKFELKNIAFNIGLRVDRFDANQLVLKDPYSLFPVRTVAQVEQSGINGIPVTIPGNISSSDFVYVDDITNPTKITGFRSGSTWYNANGTEQTDPNQIAILTKTGTITPYLVNQQQTTISASSFQQYVPQVNLMPRISFSFPISDEASFYANYDVLTMTPNAGNFGALDYYYFINTRGATATVPNPNLQPQERTNYEIGFKQRVAANAAISVNAYYGSIQDEIQLVRYSYAYPIDYTSYGNVDFATVKGVTFGFDTKHSYDHPYSGMTISANYTLAFADGTGSTVSDASNLISAGFPNLRTIYPLNWDVRDQINAILDYRFGQGPDYTGPRAKTGSGWLENAGVNLLLQAKSGTPYSAQSNVVPTQEFGISNRSVLLGSPNGSRYPWQFVANIKIDKDFYPVAKNKGKQKQLHVNVYLQCTNILNTQNVVYLYPYTGLPNQDGYLQSSNGRNEAANSASSQGFTDQYTVKMNNPANYTAPRIIRLGAYVQF